VSMRWSIQDDLSARRLVLAGAITEEADFSFLDALRGAERVAIELGDVEQINSCGVREWIHFVTRLSAAALPAELVRCSPAFVRQLNMISNFRGSAQVRSVLAPYYCEGCGHEETVEVALPEGQDPPPLAPTVTCPRCGGEAEFDDLINTYLAFLR
jgi:hypothetical protein